MLQRLLQVQWVKYVTIGIVLMVAYSMFGPNPVEPVSHENASDLPLPYEYNVIGFKIDLDENPARFSDAFTKAINEQAAKGWEYDGNCARRQGTDYSVDYLVFKKKMF